MSQETPSNGPIRGHLFSVDILIETDSNGRALERLLRLLNSPEVKDYRIHSGIELGKTIEAALQAEKELARKDAAKKASEPSGAAAPANKAAAKTPETKQAAGKTDAKTAAPAAAAPRNDSGNSTTLIKELERYKANNTLVRMTIVKAKGIKLNMPCRILNFDESSGNVTLYHVDEKKVYLFGLNEIEDLQSG